MAAAAVFDLLRHGETGFEGFRGRLDDSLSPEGWEQLRKATAHQNSWQSVVSSPLARCADFAAEVSRGLGASLTIDDRLSELDFGDWEGQDPKRLMQTDPDGLRRFWQDPWSFTPPRAESLHAFEQRVCEAWKALSDRLAGQRVLVITHGGVIRLLLILAHGKPRSELLQLEVPHASLHRIGAYGCVTT